MELSSHHNFQQTLFLQGIMKLANLLIIIFLSASRYVSAQEYGYTHYNVKEGLAGSTVYCMTQDKDGFLWIGTETGLSRFDGTHFKNYFKADGLPDNEVIQLFGDSKGRVWIAPFKKSVCYFYKGKIYNQDNDPLLKPIQVADNILRFAEDAAGNILLMEKYRLHLIDANGKVSTISQIDGRESVFTAITSHANGGFLVAENDCVWVFDHNRFTLRNKVKIKTIHYGHVTFVGQALIWRGESDVLCAGSRQSDKKFNYFLAKGLLGFRNLDSTHAVVCTQRGAFVFSIEDLNVIKTYLPDKSVSCMVRDREGNLWLSTLGEGIYRLNSAYVQNFKPGKANTSQQVWCLERYKQWILAGSDNSIIHKLDVITGVPVKQPVISPYYSVHPIITIQNFSDRKLFYATSIIVYSWSPQFKVKEELKYVYTKVFCTYRNKWLLIATAENVLRVDPDNSSIVDTIWHGRSTTVFASNDSIYIGTLHGLYCLLPDKTILNLAEKNTLLSSRIAAVTKDSNNVLWIATNGDGIVGFRNGQVIAHIDEQDGLTSNTCRAVFLNGDTLWVGTDKGLNKIILSPTGFSVQKYSTNDGLLSDIINDVYVDKSKVFIATPEGITFFDDQKMNSHSRCDLLFTDITISGRSYQWDSTMMVIPHAKNNIRFDYVGISFRSAGDIRYRYRLLGLDSNWKETRETFLSYPTLPSGDYELQLRAINKFDVYSKLITSKFTIEKLWWEKTWIRVLAGMFFLGFIVLVAWAIIYRIRKREEEKTSINKRISDLEQLARKAQMNPHFIFNSLNSIQQYVMDSDLAGANKFISGFSRLIRQTLDFSSRHEITLEEELDYLTNYLELEKTRLEDAFSWQVIIAEAINPAEYYLPPMILQPFVENSIRHGLRYRKDGKGKLLISIQIENAALVCVVEDNGIGRKAAQKFKSSSHIEYQSKGMSLTAERIAMLNQDSTSKIVMQIEDLEDDQQRALGTRVTLRFPIVT
jgi:ligand-binding sensor domain-containing protein